MSPARPESPAAWLQALDQIEASVAHALALATEVPLLPPPLGGDDPVREPLRRLEERLAGLDERLRQAEASAGGADDLLAEAIRTLGQWQEALAVTREKVADWANRAV